MTIDELIAEAKKLGGWKLVRGGIIRRRNGKCLDCPITAVAYARTKRRFGVSNWDGAAGAIGLAYKSAEAIAAATDDYGVLTKWRRALRRRMERELLS